MACRPTSPESLDDLKRLQLEVASRGDICLSLLLAGINLYVQAGRGMELLETMPNNAEEMREAIWPP